MSNLKIFSENIKTLFYALIIGWKNITQTHSNYLEEMELKLITI